MHWIIERHDVVGSTMDAAEVRAKRGAPAGVAVVAAWQSNGRGQHGRNWLAPAGTSMLMTVLARPHCSPDSLTDIPIEIGQHVGRAIERHTGLQPTIKPPNDLLVRGKKVGGILCQSSIERGEVQYVLIGIGVNANISPDDLPLPTATSLLAETGQRWDINDLLHAVLDELEHCWCFRRDEQDAHQEAITERYDLYET
jgi:BirA family transcriptional regulator, biotin operon repressor / biotin---[acetyl-CoA-carboxylase] ligase